MGTDVSKRVLAGAIIATVLPAVLSSAALAQQPGGAGTPQAATRPVLLAAGSLRAAMADILAAWRAAGGSEVEAAFGPSGKLRKDIEGGRPVDVFASASNEHTRALAQAGLLGEPKVFAHNDLCIVSTRAAGIRADNLLEVLRRPALRLATSTPVSDPMGDYTWQFFRKADARQPGLYAILDAKALKLSGTANLAPDSTLPYIAAFEQDKADAYIMYCTNAVLTTNALPHLGVLHIPDELNVRSAYGIAARQGSVEGERLLRFVLGEQAQDILRNYGFH